jgi:hypothetical protein
MKSSFSSCPHHEAFEELAALAAIGELNPLEQERLRRHLAECSQCREAYEDFADVASNDLGVAAGDRESNGLSLESADDTEAQAHLERLRNHLKRGNAGLADGASQSSPHPRAAHAARKHSGRAAIVYGIAAGLLLTIAAAGGIGLWRSTKLASAERARSRQLQSVLDSLKQDKRAERAASDNPVVRSLEESQKARDVLQKSLASSAAKNEELLARERASQERLAGAIATAEQLRLHLEAKDADRDRLAKLQLESDAKLHEALAELYQARQAPVQTAANTEPQDDANLGSTAQPSSETGAPVSPSEVEARSLFGARDLHIVDVYDVTGDGRTKRTYGRVYYVEKKLLVFYAFDLQNRGNHKRGAFQAWGYREANVGKPLNLGLFTIDDSPTSRWVLTVNRPDVLSHIDAVFVTVEPPGGSTAPRGKKVLYANLVGPPNHP